MNQIKSDYCNEFTSNYSELEYLLYKMFFHGAPTFFSEKVSSLICFKNTQSFMLKKIWDENKDFIVNTISLECYEIKRTKECAYVLFYKRDLLEDIIFNNRIKEYLYSKGYGTYNCIEDALAILKHNYMEKCPDEIGVFLGYPLSDVLQFASDKKKTSIIVGYWRVYSKVQEAMNIFKKYDQAKCWLSDTLKSGRSPLQLLDA